MGFVPTSKISWEKKNSNAIITMTMEQAYRDAYKQYFYVVNSD